MQTYSFADGTMELIQSQPMNDSTAFLFTVGILSGAADETLHQGMIDVAASLDSPSDLADRFASIYDQVMLSIPAGVLDQRPPLEAVRGTEVTALRMPLAPFTCLVFLLLLYALVGVGLSVCASRAVFGKGHAVRDAQVRLSVAGLVAEVFEDPALGDDATTMEELFAERRGWETKRVALASNDHDGRCYKLVGVDGTEEREDGHPS